MTLNRQRILRYAEYAAVSASVVGAIAAITTQQIVYGVVPLSVAAALNLANRRQWEQHIQQHLAQTTTQLGQHFDRLAEQNRQIEQRIQTLTLSASDDFARIGALQSLREEISRRTQQFSGDLQDLQQRLAQQEDIVNRSSLEAIRVDLRQLQISLVAIESGVLSFEDRLQTLEQALTTDNQAWIEDEIAQFRGDFNQISSELIKLRTEVANQQSLLRDVSSPSEAATSSSLEPESTEAVLPLWTPPQLASTQDFTLEINLGIDFGTGFTKVCFRDLASDLAEIVTFSDTVNVELEQALLSTRIAILEDGTLLTGLTSAEWDSSTHAVQTNLEFIKMRLAHLDLPENSAWRLEQIPELNDPETVENICAYYLSRVITRAQDWIQKHRADLFKNQVPRWSLNIGVPVEYCDSPALERFQRVLSLSWLLANTPASNDALTLPSLNRAGTNLRRWMQQNLDEDLDCFTTPEISAAIWSFLSSREAAEKFYTFFDFGDGTLDGTAFRFWREPDGELKVDFYMGQVRPLGVTAFTKQVALELQTSPDTVRQALLEWQQAGSSDLDLSPDLQSCQTRKQIQKLIATVINRGKQKHQEHRGLEASDELGSQLDLFVSGGGGQNPFLQATVKATYKDFQHESFGIPPYRIKQVPVPSDLTMNGLEPNEFHRFAVAYGLCIPSWEGPEIRLPSEVDMDEKPTSTWSSRVPRYEDTKDLM